MQSDRMGFSKQRESEFRYRRLVNTKNATEYIELDEQIRKFLVLGQNFVQRCFIVIYSFQCSLDDLAVQQHRHLLSKVFNDSIWATLDLQARRNRMQLDVGVDGASNVVNLLSLLSSPHRGAELLHTLATGHTQREVRPWLGKAEYSPEPPVYAP